jgi:hypothetical protein
MEKIIGVLVKYVNNVLVASRFELDYQSYKSMYPVVDCQYFDIPTRLVNGIPYDIYLDDEGLLNNKPTTAISEDGNETLVGNLFLCKHDQEEGAIASLSESDVTNILSAVKKDDEGFTYLYYSF